MTFNTELWNGQAAAAGGYEIERSLRFNSADSAYLNRTPSSAGNRKTWTLAAWVKKSAPGESFVIEARLDGSNRTDIRFTSSDQIALYETASGAVKVAKVSTQVFRDYSAWYHFTASVDTSLASPEVKMYVNGIEITTWSTNTNTLAQNAETQLGNSVDHTIGINVPLSAGAYFSGYLADVHFIDGQALDPTSFGEFDDNGIWQPIEASFTSPNNNITWSANVSASTGSIVDAALAFNGSTTSGDAYASSTAADTYIYIDFATALSGTFKLWTGMSSGSPTATVTHSGGSTVVNLSSGENTLGAFTSVTRIAVNRGEAATHSFRAVAVDGIVLVDGATKWGTNGFHLPFSDNSTAAALGDDTSGNNNDFTVNNISVAAGANNDSLLDVPQNGTEADTGAGGEVRGNYCTLNPLDGWYKITTSNGNLDVTGTSNQYGWRKGTLGVTSGKFYWECAINGQNGGVVGVCEIDAPAQTSVNDETIDLAYRNQVYCYTAGFRIYIDGSLVYTGSTVNNDDIIGVAVDLDNGKVWFSHNGVFQGSGTQDPSSNTGGYTPTNLSSGIPYFQDNAGAQVPAGKFNFGQRPFAYTAPSSFKCLCTSNLPTPAIADGSDYFDIALYTGNGSTKTISGLGFSPDLVWFKQRAGGSLSGARGHELIDIVRGTEKALASQSSGAEYTSTGSLTAFNSDGFDIGSEDRVNENNAQYVAWCWDAGSSTVSNTDGSITSSVRANPTAGFSIAAFTKTASTNETIGHGLGVAPSMIIVKTRQSSGYAGWAVYHTSTGSNGYLELNTTSAFITLSSTWNNSSPTSSVFSMGTGWTATQNMIAYCFAPVEGYSAFGSYTGNGSADGPFVYTGHRVRWILIKRTDSTGNWNIYDTQRNLYNTMNLQLVANASDAENTTTGGLVDTVSNGFKLRGTGNTTNASGATYIYAAFAESPFSIARAR